MRITPIVMMVTGLALIFSTAGKCGSDWEPPPQEVGTVIKRTDNPERHRITLEVKYSNGFVAPYRHDADDAANCKVGSKHPTCLKSQ